MLLGDYVQRLFVYTESFLRAWRAMGLSDEALSDIEELLLENPHKGDVIPGLSGARKMRIQIDGHGKRGGARVIYLDVLLSAHTYLLFAYPKKVQENLTPPQEDLLRDIIRTIKQKEVILYEEKGF